MSPLERIGSIGLAAALLAGAASSATAASGRLAPADCFSLRNWTSSKAAAPDVLYLRVGMRDVYRVDLKGGGAERLNQPSVFLTSHVRGSEQVCSPIDLDLTVTDPVGINFKLFPTAITRLTPEEAAALPKDQRP